MGSIFQKKFRKKNGEVYEGEIYWIKYYRNGKAYTESSHSTSITKAKRLLKRREGEIVKGELPGIVYDKIRFDELAKDLALHYEVEGKRSIERLQISIAHLARSSGA